VQLDDYTPVLSVLKNVRQLWLDLRRFEHSPLSLVKFASQVPAAQPLFETLLVFEKYRLDTVMRSMGGDWTKRRVELHELTNFPVTIAAYDGLELSFKIEFDRSRISPTAAKQMLRHLRCLLEGMAADPATVVGDLDLVSETERRELVEGFNVSATKPESLSLPLDGEATLHRVFEEVARQQPESVALTCDGESLTYAQLNGLANRLARTLASHGVGPDTLVGLCLDRSNHLVVALLAILKAGGGYLPIDLAYPPERIAFILEDAQAPVLLTQRKLASNLTPSKTRIICVDEILAQPSRPGEEENRYSPAGADHLAYVIYTSGTTGKPKGTLITHRNVVRLLAATEQWFGFNERDVWTLFHSAAFDFSVWEIFGALLYGGRLVVVPFLVSRSPEAFYELLAKEQVTVLNQTPSAFRQLIRLEESGELSELSLRYVIFGGEALEMQSLRPWFVRHGDKQPLLVNMYGITETTVHVTYRPLSSNDVESGSVIGVPIPDLQVYILDRQKRPVPIGVPGEMYVGGAGLARGYLRRPELSAQRFLPDHLTGKKDGRLYRTGDLARFLPGREIEYLGRVDDQVKIRGFRIELGEIESVLCQHPAIREASVLARETVPGAKQLVAYLVLAGARPGSSELREHLKKKLPEYMVPAVFVFLEVLPLTNNGKIDRKALPLPEPDRPEMANQYAAPQTDAEQKLASIWSKVLRLEKVGVHDNFFELGGDSILSIQVIALARRENLKLTPKLLFENPTVAELSRVTSLAENAEAKQEDLAGYLPLTPVQHWFLEQNLADAHHYNQAFLLEVSARLDRELLRKALHAVSSHHDSLRLRFVREDGIWRQFYSAGDPPVPLDVVDIENLSEDLQRQAIESAAKSAQAGCDLQQGPIWRVIYFEKGANAAGRLLVVVHHLAVDGVSWRPLLEDTETAYLQLARGSSVQLPAKTTSFKTWAESLQKFANSDSLEQEVSFWKRCLGGEGLARATHSQRNTEGNARTLVASLSPEETLQLLQQVPAAYHTQINDVLLTALAQARMRCTGSRVLFTNVEGHGRENLFEDLDLSRTVGWFTSIFPVRLELPGAEDDSRPGEALKSVKEQLRKIPRRGFGFGLLRYLGKARELHELPEAPMVFNYLGQFDQLLANSKIFRFASESSGQWHSPKQQRRHALEINSMIIDGRLEVRWTYCPELDSEPSVQSLADEFVRALQKLIEHCRTQGPGGRTPEDFPLVRLEQNTLDTLLAQHPNMEDLYPLSPTQTLFFSANPARMHYGFDQWHCTLIGELEVQAFQRAWHETVNRHSILRSSINSEGWPEPLQIVNSRVNLPWTQEDWRDVPAELIEERWNEFLEHDRAQPLDLFQAPVMRFALVRLADDRWKFLWTLPALFLDGWSWPLVFRDASRIYESLKRSVPLQLESAPPYRNYLEWLQRQSPEGSGKFWAEMLHDFREPTALPGERPEAFGREDRFVTHRISVAPRTAESLHATARRLQVTLNSLVQGAWAVLLSRQNDSADVVFGSAFSGRPTDLENAESIVGPFVNVLPLRVAVNPQDKVDRFFQQVHSSLLALSSHQFTPLVEIQRCSGVPERRRLFDSLVVFQNYQVDAAAKSFGGQVQISDFVGPIHTNYPLLFLAEPQAGLQFTLIYDTQVLARATVERCARDVARLLENIPISLDMHVEDLRAILSKAVDASEVPQSPQAPPRSQNFVPAHSQSELAIAAVWADLFGLDQVSVEENFFDLGGHSLLLVKMHRRLQEAMYPQLSIVTLFEHPTVRSLAQHLDQCGQASRETATGESVTRARQQRQALEQLRARLKKSSS
jgi:amino acid adenylation domain-containing protein/non-ribosomal peptide synthase protein (TIGR01720 family)